MAKHCVVCHDVQCFVAGRDIPDPDFHADRFGVGGIESQQPIDVVTNQFNAIRAVVLHVANFGSQQSGLRGIGGQFNRMNDFVALHQAGSHAAVQNGIALSVQQPSLDLDCLADAIHDLVGSHANKIGSDRKTIAGTPSDDLSPKLMVDSVTNSVSQSPRFVEVHLQNLAGSEAMPQHECSLALLFDVRCNVLSCRIRQHGRADLGFAGRVSPRQIGERFPRRFCVDASALQHNMLQPCGGRTEAIARFDVGCLPGDLRRQQIAKRRVAISVRHVVRTRYNHQRAAKITHECFENADTVGTQPSRRNVAENDDVELQPFRLGGGQRVGIAVVERTQRGSSNGDRFRDSCQSIRLKKNRLQEDASVAASEQISQIAELPTRTFFDDQNSNPIVGHPHLAGRRVVFRRLVVLNAGQFHAVVVDASLFRLVTKTDRLVMPIACDVQFSLFDNLVALEQSDRGGFMLKLVGSNDGLKIQFIADEHLRWRLQRDDFGIANRFAAANQHGIQWNAVSFEETGSGSNIRVRMVATVRQQDDSGQF